MIFCLYEIFYCDKGTRILKGSCFKVEERCIKEEKHVSHANSKISKNQVLFQE